MIILLKIKVKSDVSKLEHSIDLALVRLAGAIDVPIARLPLRLAPHRRHPQRAWNVWSDARRPYPSLFSVGCRRCFPCFLQREPTAHLNKESIRTRGHRFKSYRRDAAVAIPSSLLLRSPRRGPTVRKNVHQAMSVRTASAHRSLRCRNDDRKPYEKLFRQVPVRSRQYVDDCSPFFFERP